MYYTSEKYIRTIFECMCKLRLCMYVFLNFFFFCKNLLGEDIEPRIPRDEDMDYDDQEA